MKYISLKTAKLAIPLILANITTPLLGLVNTLVAGHLPHSYYLGAVGLGSMIINFLYWGLGFFRMVTTGLLAHAYGESNSQKFQYILKHMLLFSGLIGFSLVFLQIPIERIAFWFIHSSTAVRDYTQEYFFIRIWSAPAVLINFVIFGTLIAWQKGRTLLLLTATINLIAIVLNFLLVFYFHLAVSGIAAADVIGQYCGLVLGIFLLLTKLNWSLRDLVFSLNWEVIKAIFSANRDVFIRTLCLIFSFSFFTTQSARLGVTILATNTVLLNFQLVMAYVQDGFTSVAESLVGQRIGEKNYRALLNVIVDTGAWIAIAAVLATLLYWLTGKAVIHFMTTLPEVRNLAIHYLPYVIIFPLIASWSFWLDGVFIGANQFQAMRNTMLAATLGYMAVWWLSHEQGNSGLWLAFLSFFGFRSIFMGAQLLRKQGFTRPEN